MPTKQKKENRLLKRRSANLKKYASDYANLNLEHYTLYTGDYTNEELRGPLLQPSDEFSTYRYPLWDWFTVRNNKSGKVWWLDFSCPYYAENDTGLTERKLQLFISQQWATEDDSFKFHFTRVKDSSQKLYSLHFEDSNDYERNVRNYVQNNDWQRTFEAYTLENEKKKNWGPHPVLYLTGYRELTLLVPHSYVTNGVTFEETLHHVEEQFGKVNQNKKEAQYLIGETPYVRYLKGD